MKKEIETTNEHFTGALLDPRPIVEKQRDYKHEDIFTASATPVVWEEKTEYKFFDKRNQASSLSCMAQSGVKMLGIETKPFQTLSAKGVYLSRSNKHYGGMFQQECLDALTKPLAPLEKSLPSQNMGEEAINEPFTMSKKLEVEADEFKATKYVIMSTGNIDKVASVVAQGKAVQLMMFFTDAEWWKPIPTVIDATLTPYENRALRHGIAVVDYTLYKGEKALIIEDSSGNQYSLNGTGQRIVTESFFKARCYGIGYLTKDIPNDMIIPTFRRGATGSMVKKLQTKLGGLVVDGIFGAKTETAVKNYQLAHGLKPDGVVGTKTASQLNKDIVK